MFDKPVYSLRKFHRPAIRESLVNNSVDLIYEICKETLETQVKQKGSLEAKANTLTAFAGGMFALLMNARSTLITLPGASQILILVCTAFFSISVILCLIVTWVRRYYSCFNLEALSNKYVSKADQDTKLQLIANIRRDWETNCKLLERNASLLRAAFICQTIAFLVLGLALSLSIGWR